MDSNANVTWSWPTPLPKAKPAPAERPFGPGEPVLPAWPEEKPRVFDYQPGVNLVSTPRAGFGLVGFKELRNLAAGCHEVRLNIELVKRQVRGLKWNIEGSPEDIKTVEAFLDAPDGQHDFDAWMNALIEEVLTTDALTLWPETARGGRLTALEIIDGTTIRPLLDWRGRVCAPPTPAYVQMIHGMPMSWYDSSRLIYRPLNASVYSPYGSSPIEWVIMAVNLAMRREVNHVASFTEGNVPEALVGAPSTWQQEQINQFQTYWDAMVAGNVAAQRRMHLFPVDSGGQIPVYEFRKDDIANIERDKWLMLTACWAFGNSPAEFGLAQGEGLGGKGYSEGQENVQYRSMFAPLTQYLERLINQVIHNYLRIPATFMWVGPEPVENHLAQAQVDQIYIGSGVYTPGHVRQRLGISEDAAPEVREAPEEGPYQGEGQTMVETTETPAGGSGEGNPFRDEGGERTAEGESYP